MNIQTNIPSRNLSPTIKPNFAGIPDDLKAIPNWLLWKLLPSKKPGGKPRKFPCRADGEACSWTDPQNWSSFEAVEAACKQGGYAGIGFVFDGQPDENGLVLTGTDIDHCIDNGVVGQDAASWLSGLDTYAELSPSGTGVHAIGWAEPYTGSADGWEMWHGGRYFTITGVPVPGFNTPLAVNAAVEPFRKAAEYAQAGKGLTEARTGDRAATKHSRAAIPQPGRDRRQR